jgi:nucleoside-diphosphate-sugar epimerase
MSLGDLNINGAVGEDMPVPTSPSDFIDGYALSKARGEKVVLAANGNNGLSTVCLRPAIIYSSDDGKLAEAVLKGTLKEMIGDGTNVIDFVWADTVASAHVKAYTALRNPTNNVVAGKAYHVSQGVPTTVGDFFSSEHWKVPRPRNVPFGLVLFLAHINLTVYRAIGVAPIDFFLRPDSIKFMAGRSWWFKADRAKEDFGFEPLLSVEDTIKHMRAQADRRK